MNERRVFCKQIDIVVSHEAIRAKELRDAAEADLAVFSIST
jgi:hypothetical protein